MIRPMIHLCAAVLLLAGPAAAKMTVEELCGGLGAQGTWIGATPEASDVARAASPFRASVDLNSKPYHVHLFWVSEPTEVRLEAIPRGINRWGDHARIELRDMNDTP